MTRPLFSIITPVYNSVKGLEKTMASVLAQPALWEYIVMDGGSTDGTLELLRASGERVQWVSEPDSGVYEAMNKGIDRATGEFVYFLGAGDTLKPGILQTVAALIPRDPMTYFYGNVFSEAYGRVYNGPYNPWKISRINVCHQAVFCRRHLFDVLGKYDTRYPIMADHVWNMKCFGNAAIRKVYADIVIADFAAGGLSHLQTDPQLIADRLTLIQENLGLFPYALNKAAALLPAGLKEARFQMFQRLRSCLSRLRK